MDTVAYRKWIVLSEQTEGTFFLENRKDDNPRRLLITGTVRLITLILKHTFFPSIVPQKGLGEERRGMFWGIHAAPDCRGRQKGKSS